MPDAMPPDVVAVVTGLPCPVDAVLRARCQRCHSRPPQNGAPISLITYEDTEGAPFSTIRDFVQRGVMPPDQTLPQSDKDIIISWIDDGAPRSNDACPR